MMMLRLFTLSIFCSQYYLVDSLSMMMTTTTTKTSTISTTTQPTMIGSKKSTQTKLSFSETDRRSFLVNGFATTATLATGSTFISLSPAYAAATTTATTPAASSSTISTNSIAKRLEDNAVLNLPAPSYASEFNGIDNTYYPNFLEGLWDTTQTLVDTKTPLGLKFLGGPNGDITIAEKTLQQAQSKLNVPIHLKLRYVSTKWGVAEDRVYNNRSRLDAFAEKSVVANVQYADVGGSNRKSVLALGGTESDPLQTTIVYFKGPAAQKSFVTSHGTEKVGTNNSDSESDWAVYELQRSIFALTNQNTAPPITTDTEYIWRFHPVDENHIQAKLRIAGYLNAQTDKLYFEARNRAVSYQDYILDMKRIIT